MRAGRQRGREVLAEPGIHQPEELVVIQREHDGSSEPGQVLHERARRPGCADHCVVQASLGRLDRPAVERDDTRAPGPGAAQERPQQRRLADPRDPVQEDDANVVFERQTQQRAELVVPTDAGDWLALEPDESPSAECDGIRFGLRVAGPPTRLRTRGPPHPPLRTRRGRDRRRVCGAPREPRGLARVPGRGARRCGALRPRTSPARRTTRRRFRSSRSTRRSRWTSTRRSTSSGAVRATASATRSPTSPRSSPRAGRWTSRRTSAARRSTRRTGTPASTRRRSPRAPAASCPTRSARPSSGRWRSTGAARGSRSTSARRSSAAARSSTTRASSARWRTATAGDSLNLLQEVGLLRQEREERRGGIALPIPEQEVEQGENGYELAFRAPLPVEGWNAQISLMAGQAAAELMLGAQVGILRTLPTADPKAVERLRRTAKALGVDWAAEAHVRRRDPHASIRRCRRTRRSSPSRPSCSAAPATRPSTTRFRPARSTRASAPPMPTRPRRSAGSSTATSARSASPSRAGQQVPDWADAALPGLPETMERSNRKAQQYEAGIISTVEAALLEHRVGETFEAVVVEVDEHDGGGTVQLTEPAVTAHCEGNAAARRARRGQARRWPTSPSGRFASARQAFVGIPSSSARASPARTREPFSSANASAVSSATAASDRLPAARSTSPSTT